MKITSGTTLKTFLTGVIEESVKSGLHHRALREKEKQAAASGSSDGGDNSNNGDEGDTDLFSSDDSSDGSGDNDSGDNGDDKQAVPSKTMDDESEKMKTGDVKAKDVVERLNTIRSGKSFKDDKVKGAMEQYVESLSKAERVALYAFLKGIAQIVTGEVSGGQATEPDSHPADVKMQKGDDVQTKHVQPNVIKTAQSVKPKQSGASAENTSSPVPITPKKK